MQSAKSMKKGIKSETQKYTRKTKTLIIQTIVIHIYIILYTYREGLVQWCSWDRYARDSGNSGGAASYQFYRRRSPWLLQNPPRFKLAKPDRLVLMDEAGSDKAFEKLNGMINIRSSQNDGSFWRNFQFTSPIQFEDFQGD